MIDPNDPLIQKLTDRGYKIAAHAYLRPGGRVNYTFVAKHGKSGRVIQGWSAGGDATDAIRDLERRAGAIANVERN